MSTSIVGFDSAWTDQAKAPGAICCLRVSDNGTVEFVRPRLASFAQALQFIDDEKHLSNRCFVAIDQPTIVPNVSGSRPVDKVAGSLISWLGGGVQPANRSKLRMFDDEAPIWTFKQSLDAIENPEMARKAKAGTHIAEVFPALALPSLAIEFCGRLLGPRYNPARRKTFRIEHWNSVLSCTASASDALGLADVSVWCESHRRLTVPTKSDQDLLDAMLCAVIGYIWLFEPRERSVMIGDLTSGYMITPAIGEARIRLQAAAEARGVSCI